MSASAKAQRYTADQNTQSVQNTNDNNYRIWQEQKDYDYKMWQEQNAYNTPEAQRSRFEAAGINPQLALSNINSGSAASSAGGQEAPKMEAPINDAAAAGSAVAADKANVVNSLAAMSQIMKTSQESREIAIRNQWANVEHSLDVAGKTGDNKLKYQALQGAKLSNELFSRTFETQVQQKEFMTDLLFRQVGNEAAKGSLLELEKDIKTYYRDNIQPQELQNLKAQYQTAFANAAANMLQAQAAKQNANTSERLSYSQIEVNKATIEKFKQDVLNGIQDEGAKKFLNNLNDATWGAQLQRIKAESGNASMQGYFNFINAIQGFIPRYQYMERPLKVLCYAVSSVIIIFTALFVFALFSAYSARERIQKEMDLEQAHYDSIRALENS